MIVEDIKPVKSEREKYLKTMKEKNVFYAVVYLQFFN